MSIVSIPSHRVFTLSLFFLLLNAIYKVKCRSLDGSLDGLKNCTIHDRCSYIGKSLTDSSREYVPSCRCDDRCAIYADCCIDAAHVSRIPLVRDPMYVCVPLQAESHKGFYMIGACPEEDMELEGHERRACESVDNPSDLLASLPVTSNRTKRTYRNYYCAQCHDDYRHGLIFWQPQLTCSGHSSGEYDPEYVAAHLRYNNNNDNKNNYENNGHGVITGTWSFLANENGSKINSTSSSSLSATLGSNSHKCKMGFQEPSGTDFKIPLRSCVPDVIFECPDTMTDERIREACSDYQAVVYHYNIAYRNQHCAHCHGKDLDSLECNDINIFGDAGYVVGKKYCTNPNSIYDIFKRKCRSLVCGLQSKIIINNTCVNDPNPSGIKIPSVMEVRNGDRNDIKDKNSRVNSYKGNYANTDGNDSLFNNCTKLELTAGEYRRINKTTVYVPLFGEYFGPDRYTYKPTTTSANKTTNSGSNDIRDSGADGPLLVCAQAEPNYNRFSPTMDLITRIGLLSSIVALLIHLVAFSLIRQFRNLSGQNSVSLSIALIIGYSGFLMGNLDIIRTSVHWCFVVAILTYYFFLASFFWLNVMAYDVWRTLKMSTVKFRIHRGQHILRFGLYSLYSWLISALIAAIAVASDKGYSSLISDQFRPRFAQNGHCWFSNRLGLFLFLACPLAAIMLINSILYTWTWLMLGKRIHSSDNVGLPSKIDFKLYLKLFLLMGLTWIIGFLAAASDSQILWYCFIVLNTSQGFFIFIAFSCKTFLMSFIKNKIPYTNQLRSRSSSSMATSNIINSKF